jgi:hypothetical protein
MNAFAHCYGCHQKYGSNPDYFYRHYIDEYGVGALDPAVTRNTAVTLITSTAITLTNTE